MPMQAAPLQEEFHITLPQLGLLQSAALMGYLVGQVLPPMAITLMIPSACTACFLS